MIFLFFSFFFFFFFFIAKFVEDDILNLFYFFSEKIRHAISCESSDSLEMSSLFSLKNNNNKKNKIKNVVFYKFFLVALN